MTDTAFSAPAAEPAARRAPLDPAAVRSGRVIAAVHGVYFTLTGVWPIVHMPSFLAVTGPKTDLWLVRTVGVLVCIPGLMMLRAWRTGRIGGETLFAGCAAAAGLMVVDAVAV
ncbi:MAG TPA: hypothetical protein VFF65_09095, partial [Phycisphaerales bacterium]|nr:hypothetical protein [Phycisphaerales bacterium]